MQKKRELTKMLSKNDLLKWIYDTLQVSNSKIEGLGNGVIYCQLINHFHQHTIPQPSILREPKNEYDNMSNLKLLQTALVKLKITKEIDIAKLAKCRYQDNWELVSWLHQYLMSSHESEDYADDIPIVQKFTIGKRDHATFCQQKENFLFNRCHIVTPIGKSSVSSELFQNNYSVIIDRTKEILSKDSDDSDKIRQLKLLLNVSVRSLSYEGETEVASLDKLLEVDTVKSDQ